MLPQSVEYVLERLENAGFAAFAVAGKRSSCSFRTAT